MSDETVVLMSDHSGDNAHISVEKLLEDALAEIRSGKIAPSKAVLILDVEGAFEAWMSRMSRSEVVVACEVVKHRFIARMRGVE